MKKGKKLYEGKAKIIYATNDKNLVIQYFKDDATAFNNQKKSTIEGKGVLNNRISEYILTNLSQCGIKTHFIKNYAERVNFVPLKNDENTAKKGVSLTEEALKNFTMPFDIVILGMGADGHTASLFPCSDELGKGMDLNTGHTLISTNPKTAPYERISLTAKSIMDAKKIFLHLKQIHLPQK